MHDKLVIIFRSAISDMCKWIDSCERSENIVAIGLVTSDSVDQVGAFLLFHGDLPKDADPFMKLSPVEWKCSHEASFGGVNEYLQRLLTDGNVESTRSYVERVNAIYVACAEAFEQLNLKNRYRDLLYLSFTGTDPNDVLVEAEKQFVLRMNSSLVYEEWCNEME